MSSETSNSYACPNCHAILDQLYTKDNDRNKYDNLPAFRYCNVCDQVFRTIGKKVLYDSEVEILHNGVASMNYTVTLETDDKEKTKAIKQQLNTRILALMHNLIQNEYPRAKGTEIMRKGDFEFIHAIEKSLQYEISTQREFASMLESNTELGSA